MSIFNLHRLFVVAALVFCADRRILIWDLYNEPDNSGMGEKSLPLATAAFRWAREAKPSQPLTIGAWTDFDGRMSKALMEMSDVVSFHGYDGPAGVLGKTQICCGYNRPVLCFTLCLAGSVAAQIGEPSTAEPAESPKASESKADARELELTLRRTIAELRNVDADMESIEAASIWERPHEAEKDRRNLESNLRWIVTRLRNTENHQPATVGVFADAGVWHLGARSIVEALESDNIGCRVLDRSCLTEEQLEPFEAIVMPGGWSVFQKAAAGNAGLDAVRSFVEKGGTYLGVCAGAYLAAKDVRWQGETYPYPLILFDGIAEGSLPEVAAWPKAGDVRVQVTAAGCRRGIGPAGKGDFHYKGGPRFVGGTHVEILAGYADGSAAIITRPYGKGEVVLTGVHFERPAPSDGGDSGPVPQVAGELLKRLLFGSAEDAAVKLIEETQLEHGGR